MSEDTLENCIDKLLKTRNDLKREEFLKRQKQKKLEKKQQKKSKPKPEKFPKPKTLTILDQQKEKEQEEINQLLKDENIEIEYIDEDPKTKTKFYEDFKNVFEYFVIPKKEKRENSSDEEDNPELIEDNYDHNENFDGEINYDNLNEDNKKLSKKKRKLLNRMKISDLKQKTIHPEVVEAWDVTAQDPCLLVFLKSLKNTIPVPKHWSQKRKFLQNKRGVLKQPFKLPDFIEATGISKIRDNTGTDRKSLKSKMREKMQPKLGKLDIDYQILHDAFFKHQTKPSLTLHGDIYYENKEYENKMKIYKPGRITEKLRVCLGIPENSPPPWIINMQRYGPPPAYPNLKIPGVNAPIADPTAEITPNLWTPPTVEDKLVFIYDYKKKTGQEYWGDLREIDEEEYSDLDEDLSISDNNDLEENKNNVENIFSGFDINDIDMKNPSSQNNLNNKNGNLNNSVVNNLANNLRQLPQVENLKEEKLDLSGAIPYVPNINLNSKVSQGDMEKTDFYTVLEQKNVNIKKNEIMGSTHGYVIPGKVDEKDFKKIQGDGKEENKNVDPNKNKVKEEEEIVNKEPVQKSKKKEKEKNTFKF